MRSRIFDCITFFDNNYMFNLRYNILKEHVDYFFICESLYDHRGNKKKINFDKKKYYKSDKIKHLILQEPFPKSNNVWQNQALQREYLLKNLSKAAPEDYIFFSDPDEIPKPEILINFELNKRYGIFKQKCFNYKFNLFNKYESPWEGTRVAKKKNLHSINFMRQKIKSKNLNYSFLRFDKEKNIQIFDNAGWHFNNILSPKEISNKLKTFAHTEFANERFSSIKIIKKNINDKKDLFNRGHVYKKVEINSDYPKYITDNLDKFQKFIL